jgi:hypothetical protein
MGGATNQSVAHHPRCARCDRWLLASRSVSLKPFSRQTAQPFSVLARLTLPPSLLLANERMNACSAAIRYCAVRVAKNVPVSAMASAAFRSLSILSSRRSHALLTSSPAACSSAKHSSRHAHMQSVRETKRRYQHRHGCRR